MALIIFDLGQLEVGVVEHREGIARALGDVGVLGEQFLDLGAAHMGAAQGELVELVTVELQALGLLDEAGEALGLDRQKLGVGPGNGFAELGVERQSTVVEALEVAVALVFVGLEVGVGV
jgi:hypothetical protein